MKKVLCLFLGVIIVFSLCGCDLASNGNEFISGNVENVKVEKGEPSKIYSDEDINAAVECVKEYFKQNFHDCTLTSISYYGDDEIEPNSDLSKSKGYDETIVLISSFDTGPTNGASTGFEPNETYTGWTWTLGRKNGGNWECVNYGFC